MFVKMGHKGNQVRMIQNTLKNLSYPISDDGIFGEGTERIVRQFQHDKKINVDGIVGKNTYKTLLLSAFDKNPENKIGRHISRESKKYIGQEEISGNMGFKTPWFHKMMVGIGFKKTHPWCAYFTELVWKEAYDSFYNEQVGSVISQTFSPSVMKTWNNFGGLSAFKRSYIPTVGSLVVWQSARNRFFGHIGIVESLDYNNPYYFNTVEGNTNDGGGREGYIVAQKVREMDFTKKRSGLNLKGFIQPNSI